MSELKQIHQDIQLWMGDYDVPMRQDAYDALAMMLETYSRRTQPEATKPAQDLSAAILALEHDCTGGVGASNYIAGFNYAKQLAAALASPADALEAGDRVDAERYRWLREKRDILWKNSIPWCVHLIREHSIPTSVAIHGVALDAAIDAAIQAQKDGHG